MEAFAIDTLSIISGAQAVGGILLQTPIEGLDGPDQRTNSYANPGADGGAVSSQLYDIRFIKLTGKIVGDNPADFETNRQALIRAIQRRLDSNGRPLPVRVYFTTMGGTDYFVDCYFDKPLMDLTSPVDGTFLITGRATDPYIYANVQMSSGAISPPSGGGYTVPMIVPYTSAAATGGSAIINNPGTETAWPRVDSAGNGGIKLTGPLTTPVLTNSTTGKYLQLGYNIASGDVVKIDMFSHTITLNGASLISTKTSTSDWWGLQPGNNTIALTTTSSSDTGSMIVAFNPPYVGV